MAEEAARITLAVRRVEKRVAKPVGEILVGLKVVGELGPDPYRQ